MAGDNREEVVVIRTTVSLTNDERREIIDDMQKTFGITDEDVLLQSASSVLSVGKELTSKAIKALMIATIGMLIHSIPF